MTDLVASRSPFVDGRFLTGDAGALGVVNPATEEVGFEVEASSVAQFDAAIVAARRAFDEGPWPRMSMAERAAAMHRLADALYARNDVLVESVIVEAGATRTMAQMMQVGFGLNASREMVDLALPLPEWEHNEVPFPHLIGARAVKVSTRRWEPVGVVAAITPSNFPFTTNVWKLTPALMAGCSVVLRPSPQTPLEALAYAEAAEEAGIPPGVVNVLVEGGPEGAALLSTHPGVDLVSFTGSSGVGAAIGAQAAPSMKRLILELGGKSVQLYLDDALEAGPGKAVGGAMAVFMAHAGQGCSLQTRMLVPHARKAAVLDALAAAGPSITIGDPQDAATVLGPVVSAGSRDRIERLVAEGVAAGGRVVTGGKRPEHMERGFYFEPTVVDIDDNSNPLAQQEVFGPVITVQGYGDLDEAVAITNDSHYDLSAGVYTADLDTASDLAGRIRTGTVQVNAGLANSYTPMGGYKNSGVGRERGVLGLRAFQQAKHVVFGNG